MTKTNNAIVVTSIISVVILIIAMVAIFTLAPKNYNDETINVQGVATVKTMPDSIGIYFNIQTKGKTALEAKTPNSEILNKLISDLVSEEGLTREEIVTESFNVYPEYTWDNGRQEENGYVATHSVSVKVDADDSAKVGRIIDIGIRAGAGVSYVNFELSQESQSKYKAEAMKLASQDAKMKAISVAEGVDKKIGEIVSIQINDFGYAPWMAYDNSAGMLKASTAMEEIGSNIQPGEKEISATVNVIFELE